MLRSIPFDVLPETSKTQYLFEKGRALASLGKYAHAEQCYSHALLQIQQAPRANLQHKALVLAGLAASLIDQQKTYMAAHHLCAATQLTRSLTASVVEIVMRTIARYFLAIGNKQRHAQALRTVLEIVQSDERDPVRRGIVLIEVRLAEKDIGECTVDLEFARAIKTVRASGRYGRDLRDASIVLGAGIKPTRRLRGKTHPEDILLR